MKRLVKGFFISLGMFSVVPVPFFDWDDDSMGLVIPFLPLVGGVVGGLWCLGGWLLRLWPPPLLLHGLFFALLPILLTGMLHLDGFMDTMDAVLSCRDREERMRILKDPHMGAFGVASFCMLLLTYFCTGVTLAEHGYSLLLLVLIPVLSRIVVALAMNNMGTMSPTGYAATFARRRGNIYRVLNTLAGGLVVLGAYTLCGWASALALVVLVVVGGVAGLFLKRQFGGISGDLCGCMITVSELAALLTLAVC